MLLLQCVLIQINSRSFKGLSASLDADSEVLTPSNVKLKVLVIAINSNRGLSGAFNSNIIKEANHLVNEVYASKEVFITMGKQRCY